MGDKDEKRTALEMIDDSINTVSDRLSELQYKLDRETDPDELAHIKKEISYTTQQLNYVKSCKLEYEEQLQKAESDEKKKQIESIVKMALFAGVIFENNRIKMEREKVLDRDMDIVHQAQFELAVKKVFDTTDFRYIDESMVDDILANKTFEEMSEKDPNRLERVEKDVKAVYERAMTRTLSYYGMDVEGDFKETEEKFRNVMKQKNGYEIVAKKFVERMAPLLESAGTKEDKEFFAKFKKDVVELGAQIKQLQLDFVDGESDFIKGNGFTKELIDKENDVLSRLDDYIQNKLLVRANDEKVLNSKDKKDEDLLSMYQVALEFIDPIKVQNNRDLALNQNNELRKQMEMWQVYERLKGASLTEKQKKNIADDEFKAWAKLDRMTRMGAEVGGIYEETANFAMQRAQQVLIMAKKKKQDLQNFTHQDKELVKEHIAALVLHQIIDDEMKSPVNADKRHTNDYNSGRPSNKQVHFNTKVRDFAKSPAFEAAYSKYMKGKNFTTACIKFLANDTEKEMAREIKKAEVKDLVKSKSAKK